LLLKPGHKKQEIWATVKYPIVPQLHYLKINGCNAKTNNMIKMELIWIESCAVSFKMTTAQQR
jgi:hypothetical protein